MDQFLGGVGNCCPSGNSGGLKHLYSTEAATTNAIESLISRTRHVKRNVKRRRGGHMVLRWTAAAMLEAVKGFRRLKGHKEMPKLVAGLRARDQQLGIAMSVENVTELPLNFNSRRGNPRLRRDDAEVRGSGGRRRYRCPAAGNILGREMWDADRRVRCALDAQLRQGRTSVGKERGS